VSWVHRKTAPEVIVKLTWKRQEWFGTYRASTETHKFAVDKIGSKWQLRIWTQQTLDTLPKLVAITDEFPTMTAAKADAQQFADQRGA
jgi:hypothetical protein